MSHPSVKWIPGVPDQLKVGMVVKMKTGEVRLIGTPYSQDEGVFAGDIEAHGQLVDAYVLEWLGNDGIVKGVSR